MDSKHTRIPNRTTALNIAGALLLIAVVLPFVIFAIPQVAGADHSYVVVSSSMNPAISANDAIVVNDVSPTSVREADVIVFRNQGGTDSNGIDVTSHRVVDVTSGENGLAFETKGDANEEADRGLVPASALVGRVAFTIPFIGYVVGFAGTQMGFIALVAVPLGLLVLGELYDLGRAARNSYEASGASAESDERPETDGGTDTDGQRGADEAKLEER